MIGWILIAIGYVLLIGGFRVLGGVSSAMDALRTWGRTSAGPQPSVSSS
jgi:Na+/pantothenate symporter